MSFHFQYLSSSCQKQGCVACCPASPFFCSNWPVFCGLGVGVSTQSWAVPQAVGGKLGLGAPGPAVGDSWISRGRAFSPTPEQTVSEHHCWRIWLCFLEITDSVKRWHVQNCIKGKLCWLAWVNNRISSAKKYLKEDLVYASESVVGVMHRRCLFLS